MAQKKIRYNIPHHNHEFTRISTHSQWIIFVNLKRNLSFFGSFMIFACRFCSSYFSLYLIWNNVNKKVREKKTSKKIYIQRNFCNKTKNSFKSIRNKSNGKFGFIVELTEKQRQNQKKKKEEQNNLMQNVGNIIQTHTINSNNK